MTSSNTSGPDSAAQLSPQLTLYSRVGCHLCEDMAGLLDEFCADRYRVNAVNIDVNESLCERFNLLVPALYLDDQEICHHFLDLSALNSALHEFNVLQEISKTTIANQLE